INAYQYVPNPTGWVDPLGLNKCPGKCGPFEDVEDPANSARVKGDQPTLPAPEEIEWTAHGYKHSPSKKMPWKDILATTKSGPAKYKP
ncbi:hypothetical protein O6467_24845, partial [Salmonella enterica subsp. enterica]